VFQRRMYASKLSNKSCKQTVQDNLPNSTPVCLPTETAGTGFRLPFWPTQPMLARSSPAHTYSFEKVLFWWPSKTKLQDRTWNMLNCLVLFWVISLLLLIHPTALSNWFWLWFNQTSFTFQQRNNEQFQLPIQTIKDPFSLESVFPQPKFGTWKYGGVEYIYTFNIWPTYNKHIEYIRKCLPMQKKKILN